MSQIAPAPPTEPSRKLETSIHCLQCGYDLIGLPDDGTCSECGAMVADSVRGTILRSSSPEFLATLHKGVFIIQSTIIAMIIASVLSVVAAVIVANLNPDSVLSQVLIGLVGFVSVAAMGVMVYGWLLFAATDPSSAGPDAGEKPRQYARVTIIAATAIAALEWLITVGVELSANSSSNQSAAYVLLVGLNVVQLAVQVAAFICAMWYVKWLGARIPNARIVERAHLLRWLGPVLMTVGVLIVIGPLIALIMFWNLLDWVRKDLKAIRQDVGTGATNLSFD